MRSILDCRPLLIDETEVGLVHECRRLQCVISAFGPEPLASNPPQFVVQERQELVERGYIASASPFRQAASLRPRREVLGH